MNCVKCGLQYLLIGKGDGVGVTTLSLLQIIKTFFCNLSHTMHLLLDIAFLLVAYVLSCQPNRTIWLAPESNISREKVFYYRYRKIINHHTYV
jgi:hypothetical protein